MAALSARFIDHPPDPLRMLVRRPCPQADDGARWFHSVVDPSVCALSP
jgi:hypothetical protein